MTSVIAGEVVEIKHSKSGFVYWLSNWSLADALVTAKILRKENYGPAFYGHVDYFLREN